MNTRMGKWILRSIQVLLGLVLMLGVVPAGAHLSGGYLHHDKAGTWNYSNPDWMEGIPDYRRLSELSIPATHDTMAMHGGGGIEGPYIETQALDLKTQLESGIRSIDIRLQRNNGFLECWHGDGDLDADFYDVLEILVAFLKVHHNETVFMVLAENSKPPKGDGNYNFVEMVEDYLQPYTDWIWKPTSANPTLGEVRGKIVILEHFSNKPIDDEGDVGMYTSLALDSAGKPHISYYNATSEELWYASWALDHWDKSLIDGFNDMGKYSSLAWDKKNDRPYISYYDATMGELRIAMYFGGSNGNCVNPDWSCTVIDGGPGIDVGLYTSLALDTSGNPHISYYDATNSELRYTRWNGSNWDYAVVDSVDDVGQYSSLALDDNDLPHFSYYDETNNDLKYAFWDNLHGWVSQIVDGVGDVGQYTSIALDEINRPHISYYDATNSELRYTRWTGNNWYYAVVDSVDDVGKYSSLALDDNDRPHFIYYDETNKGLKYAFWDNLHGWFSQIMDMAGDYPDVGQYTSIALDENNQPHISYYDVTDGDLKYAGSSWICGDGVPRITKFGLKNGPPCLIEKVYWAMCMPNSIYKYKWPLIKSALIEADEGPRDKFYTGGLNATSTGAYPCGIFCSLVGDCPWPWFVVSGHENSDTGAGRKQVKIWDEFYTYETIDCVDGNPPVEFSDFPCRDGKMLYEGTNELTLTYLNAHPALLQPRRWGFVVTDFPGEQLIDAIINSNFPSMNPLFIPAILK